MDFGKLLQGLKESFSKPSILGNLVSGKQFNESLPRFGGVAPESQMVQNPNVASPLQAPDELTPGMIHQQKFEEALPQGGAPIPQPTAIPTPTPTPVPEVLGASVPEPRTLEELIVDVMNKNKIPTPVGLGIAQAEGGKIGSNNPYNINAHDSRPTDAVDYPTLEAGVQAFADLINNNSNYAKATQFRDDPNSMVQAIQEANYAGDPNTWKQRSIDTGGAGRSFDQWSDFVKSTKGYRRYVN